MKKFLRNAYQWVSGACLGFTASMLIHVLVARIQGQSTVETRVVGSTLLLIGLGSFTQYLCFTDNIIRRMRYTRRLLLFGAIFLPVLALIAWLFQWLPVEKAGAWGLFFGIAVAVFAVMTLFFELFYQLSGRRYEGLLGQYKRSHGQD